MAYFLELFPSTRLAQTILVENTPIVINGLGFHQELLAGEVSYKDERVVSVFEALGDLVDNGYFLKSHETIDWRGALPYLYRDMTGMFLMGNFWTSQIPDGYQDKISFFRFPEINGEIPAYEEAPTDILFMPSNVVNRENAIAFLDFMSRSGVQAELNQAIGMLAPQIIPNQKMDLFMEKGAKMLSEAEGLSQYFDRDNPQPIAVDGMQQILRFMTDTTQLPLVLDSLEKLRQESF